MNGGTWYRNLYVCPCGNEWREECEHALEADCPDCGHRCFPRRSVRLDDTTMGVIDANTQRRQRTMTDAKHVYEPSEAAPSPRGACVITGAPGENPDDCTTHAHEGPPVDCANARLIAAAPDLLACCRRALTDSARVHPDFADQLRAAIAKATGDA